MSASPAGRARRSVAAFVLAVVACALHAEAARQQSQAPPAAASSTAGLALPDGAGKAVVERVCSGCHEPSLVMFKREDEEGWAAIVQDMAARGAKGTPADLDAITAYLAANFNRTRGFGGLVTRGADAAASAKDDQQRFAAGRQIYDSVCVVCHQPDGRGRQNVAPSIVGSPLVLAPPAVPVRIMLHGKRGTANVMPALGMLMTDDQIAAALTYLRREWGHTAPGIDTAMVKEIRAQTAGRARPWTAEELQQFAGPVKGGLRE